LLKFNLGLLVRKFNFRPVAGNGAWLRIAAEFEKRIQRLLKTKKGMLAIAKECGVDTGAVQRIAREMTGSPFVAARAAA
jgi:hypothetical protein